MVDKEKVKSKRKYFVKDENSIKLSKLKAARLIVRNLPFKSSEEKLKQHFSQFGNVVDVNILRKDGGKLVGCGFVQFENKLSAAKAIAKCSGKPFLGRVIIVDWALSKKAFVSNLKKNSKSSSNEVKEETLSDTEVKEEIDSDDDEKPRIKDEVEKSGETSSEEEDGTDDDKRDGSSDEDSDDSDRSRTDEEGSDNDDERSDADSEEDVKPNVGKLRKRKSNDVTEGRTVFIKNVPFDASEEDLTTAVRKFGRIFYAKICIDKVTEHPKGTAFVKFLKKESADACLSAGTEFEINGTVLDPHPAVLKKEILKKKDTKAKTPTDSRNLYLLKEGVVLPGTKAAEGVSEGDMSRRLYLEKWKRQIIKDLAKFVSRTRLAIHNLPLTCDDKRLAAIVKKHSPKSAVLTECRIMRDLKNVDGNGVGLSKGYGFVTFTEHEDALAALRSLNNNPSVFKVHRRPIVSFSIESKIALNIKKKRLEKSKELLKKVKEEPVIKVEGKVKKEKKGREGKNVEKKGRDVKSKMAADSKIVGDEERKEFVGVEATPGTKKFLNNFDISTQTKIHKMNVKKAKARNKHRKITRNKMRELRKKIHATKMKTHNQEDDFSKLVNKYRNQIKESVSQKKWFDE